MNDTSLKYNLQTVLRLDSIYNFLTFSERMNIRGYLLNWDWAKVPKKIEWLIIWLDEHPHYEAPSIRVGADRLYYVDGILQSEYLAKNNHIKSEIFKLLYL